MRCIIVFKPRPVELYNTINGISMNFSSLGSCFRWIDQNNGWHYCSIHFFGGYMLIECQRNGEVITSRWGKWH